MTITEGLAEIKTIFKRIEKKQEFVARHICRQNMINDPLEKEGGSRAIVAAENQAIKDLLNRVVEIRRAINDANRNTKVKCGNTTLPVSDWLVWRREVAPVEQARLSGMAHALERVRGEATKKGLRVAENTGEREDVIVNISETELANNRESIEEILGSLDGKLSVVNATTQISV